MIADGRNGILVDPLSLSEVSDAVMRMATEESVRESMGCKGRERWEEQFHIDRMLMDYDVYLRQASRSAHEKR